MTNIFPWLSWPETKELAAAIGADKIRFVGGAVRDSLIGREVHDIDAATPLVPSEIMALLGKANISAIPTGIAHGTVTAVINKKHFEITSLRKDIATDGRHAEVEFTDSWQEDAARRDFTMNALYLSAGGELFDYFGGETDAKNGRVCFIGDAKLRIKEDYLRILRFFRFYAHYGKTAPDAKALAACAEAAEKIASLSAERVQYELQKLLSAPKSYHAISFMYEGKILPHVLGFDISSRAPLRRLEEMMAAFSQPVSVAAKLTSLLDSATSETSVDAIAARLKLSNVFSNHMRDLKKICPLISLSLSFPEEKRLIRKYGADLIIESILLVWANGNEIITANHPYHSMLTLAREWSAPEFPVGGKDLQGLGIAEGRELGAILGKLEEAWEKSDYKMTKEELLAQIPR